MTTILAVIGAAVVVFGALAEIPPALAALVRACIPVVAAVRELRAALSRAEGRSARQGDGEDRGARAAADRGRAA
ncbi:hypothetical protein, partial [Actinacidiphila bryophytorum]|uniref:hypothetical protein n=1 Tax=Actinacidiphila bryophytorum TaxID=1436133 RepID=UPI00197F30BB